MLLAVSGGPDSVCLMTASARIAGRVGLRFEVATVDHGLRAEAADEARQVGRQAWALGLSHTILPLGPRPKSGNLEAWARQERYAALERHRQARGLELVATAHTASDQAETVLMRLSRGTALDGAAGIHELRADRVVRPLLGLGRAAIEAYVEALKLEVARDPMNHDPASLRVRMRTVVLPVLEQAAGPHASETLARFAALAAEDEAFLEGQAQVAFRSVAGPDGTLERESLLALVRPLARRVVSRWLAGHGLPVDAELVAELLRAAQEGRSTPLPHDKILALDDGRLSVRSAPPRGLHPNSS